ncbi:CASTOR/POLLUX-related putative ion channel [Wenzhouxiangella marina]|uniref:Ion channel DMI1 n=1 Tax=Wenzhouxiangella marina TaxID=1579979 RepID=A0A0K0XX82_9GAMM|nr:hypothetical protein [Wenzhouxiangella marina]AKS42290.1 Ion channel DMI1 [Wenzhouxiangella marina]MBB6085937.1 hypothetical protein [Wenzhouxiangella marina]
MIKLPLIDRLTFLLERQFVKGAGFQLLIVAAAIGLISLAGGIAVHWSGHEDGLSESIWWAFLRLTDPGYLGDDEGAWRRIVSTFLTLSGYVVFLGALVAIMTQWLIGRMREFERGLTPVSLRGHAVIVGWTNRTVPLLRELIGTQRSRRRFRLTFGRRRFQAVILTEDVSAEQGQVLRSDPWIGPRARDVILRDGSALEEEAIHRAGCLNASMVIMPTGFGRRTGLLDVDVETIRALLSMDAGADQQGLARPLVVAELQDARRAEMARNAYRGPLELVASDQTISRIMVQTMLHPGLSRLCRELLSGLAGNELMLARADSLAGASLQELASLGGQALLLGLVQGEGPAARVTLLPPSSTRLQSGDQLIWLAQDPEAIDVTQHRRRRRVSAARQISVGVRPRAGAPHRLLILGWNQRVPRLLAELAAHPGQAFEVDLLSSSPLDARLRDLERYFDGPAPVELRQHEADFLLSGVLESFDPGRFDTVLLLSSDRLGSEEEADARSIVGQRLVERLLERRAERPQVLVELADSANEGLVQGIRTETLISPLLISHLLARIALQPALGLIFEALFGPDGPEIAFLAPRDFGLTGSQSVGQIEQAVAARGGLLLGIDLTARQRGEGLCLNPTPDLSVDLDLPVRLCLLRPGISNGTH